MMVWQDGNHDQEDREKSRRKKCAAAKIPSISTQSGQHKYYRKLVCSVSASYGCRHAQKRKRTTVFKSSPEKESHAHHA